MNNPWIAHNQKYKGQGLTREEISDLYYGKKSTNKSTKKSSGGGVTTRPMFRNNRNNKEDKPKLSLAELYRQQVAQVEALKKALPKRTQEEENIEAHRIIQDALEHKRISAQDKVFMESLGDVPKGILNLAIAKGERLDEESMLARGRRGHFLATIPSEEEKKKMISELQKEICLGIATEQEFKTLYFLIHHKPQSFIDNVKDIYNLIIPHVKQISGFIANNFITKAIAGADIPEASDVAKGIVKGDDKIQTLPDSLLTDYQIQQKERDEEARKAYNEQKIVGRGIQNKKNKKKRF
jgi:hypothetical protein